MPVITKGQLKIDYTEVGQGENVVLIHSSISGNRQWQILAGELKDRFRVLAVNLYGYGETTAWPDRAAQSLYAQAQLILAVCEDIERPIHLVGHSFGGSVALKAAALLGQKVSKLILLEPNPFYLLKQHGRDEAFMEARALRDHVKCYGSLGDWPVVAERFADYWLGAGSWAAMPEKRRGAFTTALVPNFYEWDAVMDEQTTLDEWRQLPARTLVVHATPTVRPIEEIVQLFANACPAWSFIEVPEGGHMAPLTQPELINPIVDRFLSEGRG